MVSGAPLLELSPSESSRGTAPADVFGTLIRLARSMSGLTFQVQSDLILTTSQFFVLDSLATTTIGNASDIAKSMLYDKGSMVRLLDGLEERQLITRCRVIGDRRRINIALTTLGKEAADACKALYQSLCDRTFANVDLVELDCLLTVLSLVDHRIAQSKSTFPLKSN